MNAVRRAQSSRSPRIALIGIFGRTNLGNEATLASLLAEVRRRFPVARIACIGPEDGAVEERYGLPVIDMEPLPVRRYLSRYDHHRFARPIGKLGQIVTEPIRLARAGRTMEEFDLLVIPGTGILDDYGQGPLDMPAHLLRWCRAASKAGVPVYFLSVGTEPVESERIRRLFREAAEHATYRSYRDHESWENTAALGVDVAADPVYPDLAFSLPDAQIPGFEPVRWPPRTVGIGVMGYYGWNKGAEEGERIYQRYMTKLKNFVSGLLARGKAVRLLVGDTRADARPIRDLVEAVSCKDPADGPAVVAEPIHSFEDLLREIALTDVTVVTRFHNLLLSLMMERPSISLSYSSKNDALLDEIGLGHLCQPIEDFDEAKLWLQFDNLIREPPPVDTIRNHNRLFRNRLRHQYDLVFADVTGDDRT